MFTIIRLFNSLMSTPTHPQKELKKEAIIGMKARLQVYEKASTHIQWGQNGTICKLYNVGVDKPHPDLIIHSGAVEIYQSDLKNLVERDKGIFEVNGEYTFTFVKIDTVILEK